MPLSGQISSGPCSFSIGRPKAEPDPDNGISILSSCFRGLLALLQISGFSGGNNLLEGHGVVDRQATAVVEFRGRVHNPAIAPGYFYLNLPVGGFYLHLLALQHFAPRLGDPNA